MPPAVPLAVAPTLAAPPPPPAPARARTFTPASLAASRGAGERLILIGDCVYDVAPLFAPGAHPGGAEVLAEVVGGDATDQFASCHPEWVRARLGALRVGRMRGWAPPPATVAYRALHAALTAEGQFAATRGYYAAVAARCAALLGAALGAVACSRGTGAHLLLGAPALGVFWQQLAFAGHDLGHSSVSGSRARDGAVGLLVGPALTGLSFSWWKATHHAHHVATNSATGDPDVQHTPLLAVSPVFFGSLWSDFHAKRMGFGSCARASVVRQHLFFYPLMFWARWNLYAQGVMALALGPKDAAACKGAAALLVFATWVGALVAAVGRGEPTLARALAARVAFLCLANGVAGALHVQIVLSHFAQPVLAGRAPEAGLSFLEAQLAGTTNIALPRALDFTFGGLQYQVEHHLFPRLPAERLRALAPRVAALCAAHGLAYHSATFWEANANLYASLRATARAADKLDGRVLDALLLRG